VSKLVPCCNKEEAEVAASAGALWLRFATGWETLDAGEALYFIMHYGTRLWPPEDYAIMVEDEDDNG